MKLKPLALARIPLVRESFLARTLWWESFPTALAQQRNVVLYTGFQPPSASDIQPWSGDGIKPRAKRSKPWGNGSRNPQPPTGATEGLCAVGPIGLIVVPEQFRRSGPQTRHKGLWQVHELSGLRTRPTRLFFEESGGRDARTPRHF